MCTYVHIYIYSYLHICIYIYIHNAHLTPRLAVLALFERHFAQFAHEIVKIEKSDKRDTTRDSELSQGA